jgi:uncharacterized protein YeaO (DUF488 family)
MSAIEILSVQVDELRQAYEIAEAGFMAYKSEKHSDLSSAVERTIHVLLENLTTKLRKAYETAEAGFMEYKSGKHSELSSADELTINDLLENLTALLYTEYCNLDDKIKFYHKTGRIEVYNIMD